MANVLFRESNVPYGDEPFSLSVSIDIEDEKIDEVCEKVIRIKESLDNGEYYDSEYYDDFGDGAEKLGWHEKIKAVLDVVVGKDKWKDNTENFTFYVD